MQHSTGQYDDLARVPRARPRERCRRRTTASRHRRRSPARCSCRVVSPIRDAWFVDLILAVFMCNSGRRQERVCRAQRPGAKRYRDLGRRKGPPVPHLNPRKWSGCPVPSAHTGEGAACWPLDPAVTISSASKSSRSCVSWSALRKRGACRAARRQFNAALRQLWRDLAHEPPARRS
jgi:hypothetical protein